MPHHVTQRGNRRCIVFKDDVDRRSYLAMLMEYVQRHGLAIQAYCLMTNHVHFVAVPRQAYSLGLVFRDTNRAYAARFNYRQGESGHLWQGRFYSTVLDEGHFWAAVRYVERNPVRAKMVQHAWEYPWSSAGAHCGLRADPLLSGELEKLCPAADWREFLMDEDELAVKLLRQRTRTGRPCGDDSFLEQLESRLGRLLRRQKPGPKPKER